MKNRQIYFTAPNVAELVENEVADTLLPGQVRVKTKYTAISAGTERANLIGEVNISGVRSLCNDKFPRKLGYCGVGTVVEIGSDVKKVKVGQRVVIYFGKHSEYNVLPENNIIPIIPDDLSDEDVVFSVIGCFPAGAVRKTRLEFGESVSVIGVGILGLIAVMVAKAAGATPVIAVDPNPDCRQRALEFGADYAIDPMAEDYKDSVMKLTNGKGVDVTIEASGSTKALNAALPLCRKLGRVALLGCTRTPDTIDLYHDVHFTGVSLIGAHNFTRPLVDSYPGNWTFEDEIHGLMRLEKLGRINMKGLISEIHSPAECGDVYTRLAFDRYFPAGVLFDWDKL